MKVSIFITLLWRQVETWNADARIHAGACILQVFKLKGTYWAVNWSNWFLIDRSIVPVTDWSSVSVIDWSIVPVIDWSIVPVIDWSSVPLIDWSNALVKA